MITKLKDFFLTNTSPKQTLAKNTFWLLIAERVNKGGAFFLMLLIAQHIGPTQFGEMSYIISFVSLFVILVDYGLVNLTIREMSISPDQTTTYFMHGIYLKLLLGICNFVIVLLVGYFITSGGISFSLILVYCAYSIINNLGEYTRILFRPKERMEYEAYIKIANGLVFFGVVFFATIKRAQVQAIFWGFLLSTCLNLIICLAYILHHFPFSSESFLFSPSLLFTLLKKGLILAGSMFFINILINVDQFLLGYFGFTYDLGIYALGYKMTFIYTVVFAMFFQTLLPRVAKQPSRTTYTEGAHRIHQINVALLILYGSSISFLYRQPYRDIGAYQSSLLVFLVLLLYCVFESYGHRGYIHLLALGKEKIILYIFMSCAVFNLLANLVFIPIYSYRGAIVVTIFSYSIYAFSSFWYVRDAYQGRMTPP